MSAVTTYSDLGAQENKVSICTVFLSICYEIMALDSMIFVFWMLIFKPAL